LPHNDQPSERDRIVVELAGAVAHKLKQPLAVAWGYLELLLDDPDVELDPKTLRYLREIQDALGTMDEIVNKLQETREYQTRPYAGELDVLSF
jgi:signal transduction histidine kinase